MKLRRLLPVAFLLPALVGCTSTTSSNNTGGTGVTTTVVSEAPTTAPVTAPTTAAPVTASTTTAPVTAAPATAASCHPLTNSGGCYQPGEFCRTSDHGVIGVAGDGEQITCKDNNGWRWEPS